MKINIFDYQVQMNYIEVESSKISFMTYRFFPGETHRNEKKKSFLNIHNIIQQTHFRFFSFQTVGLIRKKSKIGEKVHKIYMKKD